MEGNDVRLFPKAALFSRGIRVVRHPAFARPHRNKSTISNRFQKRVKTKGDTMTRKLIMLTGTLLLGGCVAMAQAGAGSRSWRRKRVRCWSKCRPIYRQQHRFDGIADRISHRFDGCADADNPRNSRHSGGTRPRLLRVRRREAPQPIPIAPCPVQVRLSRVPRPPRPPEQPLPQRQAQYRHPAPIRT